VLLDNLSAITEAPLGKLDLGKDTTLCFGEKLELKADFPSATTTWSDNSMGSTLEVDKEGTYKVKVSNSCTFLEDEIVVSFRDCIEKFKIPNVFTPNEDKFNDSFFIEGLPKRGWHLEVFNKWGKPVCNKEDYAGDWKAEGLPTGTYYYQLSKEGIKSFKGWVLVLR
jgi:gliding motility-associated-like protein